jgi:hypothetical protein
LKNELEKQKSAVKKASEAQTELQARADVSLQLTAGPEGGGAPELLAEEEWAGDACHLRSARSKRARRNRLSWQEALNKNNTQPRGMEKNNHYSALRPSPPGTSTAIAAGHQRGAGGAVAGGGGGVCMVTCHSYTGPFLTAMCANADRNARSEPIADSKAV